MAVSMDIHQTANVDESVRIVGSGSLHLGMYSSIEPNVFIDLGSGGDVFIGDRTKIKYGAVLRAYDGSIDINNRVSIGEYTLCAGHGGLTINDNVIIAGHCYITASEHIYDSELATRFQGEICEGIVIGENCWIGANVTILDGTVLGKGSIIGAGAVVNKDTIENSINVGIPCRAVKLLGRNE